MTASNTDDERTEQSDGPEALLDRYDLAGVDRDAHKKRVIGRRGFTNGKLAHNGSATTHVVLIGRKRGPLRRLGLSPVEKGKNANSDLPPEHQPIIPDRINGEAFTYYRCKVCKDPCINPRGTLYADDRQCRHCAALPDIKEHDGMTDEDVRHAIEATETVESAAPADD